MITDQRIGPYLVEIDENGDEVLSLELPWKLPANYHAREVELAERNVDVCWDRLDLLVSRRVLHEGIQAWRAGVRPAWGEKFDTEEKRMAIRDAKRGAS